MIGMWMTNNNTTTPPTGRRGDRSYMAFEFECVKMNLRKKGSHNKLYTANWLEKNKHILDVYSRLSYSAK